MQIKEKESLNPTKIVWILGALATVSPFAIDFYLPAFELIATDFQSTPARVSLSVSSYFIGMAVGQLIYGPLLDRFGRKKPLYGGLSLFILATLGCVGCETVDQLVILRFFQALGGSVAWVAAVAMVRDFFPVKESARIFSLLILILGVSPLLAPTLGGFIATAAGWEMIFIFLAGIVLLILIVCIFFLPEGHQPDRTISLRPGAMMSTYLSVLRNPQFSTYTFAGAFGFAPLFVYVAGSPVIFMGIFKVSPEVYGGIFALLSIGFIGSSQFNIYLIRRFSSEKIFNVVLLAEVIVAGVFLMLAWNEWIGLYGTIAMFFLALSCIGLLNPNANAIALAPFTRNVGSASALLGFTQIGVAAIASSGVGLLDSRDTIAIVSLMLCTTVIALVILLIGKRKIGPVALSEGSSGPLAH